MSRITQMMGKQMIQSSLVPEPKVTQIALRLTAFQTWQLDRIRPVFQNTPRTNLLVKLVGESLTDALECMGLSYSDQRDIFNAEMMKISLEEYRAKMADAGIYINGEKINLEGVEPSEEKEGAENV